MTKPTFEFQTQPDLDLLVDIAELAGDREPVESYAIIEGAKYALESYTKMTAQGVPATFGEVVARTKTDIIDERLHSDSWKCSDEFMLGVAVGALLARRADHRGEVVLPEIKQAIRLPLRASSVDSSGEPEYIDVPAVAGSETIVITGDHL